MHVGSLDLRANIMIRQIVEVVTDYEKVLYYTIHIIHTMYIPIQYSYTEYIIHILDTNFISHHIHSITNACIPSITVC